MKIRNLTALPSDYFRELIKFAQPAGVTDVFVTFKYRRVYCGNANYANWQGNKSGEGRVYLEKKRGWTECPDVVIGLRKDPRGKGKIENRNDWVAQRKRGYLQSTEYTQEEAILHLLAHELRHLQQSKGRIRSRVWGARGRFSERDCDAYAIGVVRHWRRAGSPFYGSKGEVLYGRSV